MTSPRRLGRPALAVACASLAVPFLVAAQSGARPATTAHRAGPASIASRRVDSLMRAEMAKRVIPGAAVVVVQRGRVVKKSAYGLASVELAVPATTRSLFQIASATKNVTGLATMQLVEAGKFALDDKVTDLLPGLPETWRPVTVRQLLSHTSGLPDVILNLQTGEWIPGSRDSVLKVLATMPHKPAGSAWSYNQTNYLLLGMLIETFGGLPYRDYFRQRVLGPMGVREIAFGDSRSVIGGRVTEYTRLGLPKEISKLTELRGLDYQYPDALYTAAGIFMHADDMARWLVGVSKGAGLAPATFSTMTTTVALNDGTVFHFPGSQDGYALGWLTRDAPGNRLYGGSGGGRTALFFYPDDGLAVAVMTNLQGAGPEGLVELVAGIYRPSH
ncbi:MAG TPA: serine hydrolase domain-containing protein [Gemmatimonadaceae bacterium]|nr:serine hydrolase domain-containing protein [Gemmatimonadaceae bacterium]